MNLDEDAPYSQEIIDQWVKHKEKRKNRQLRAQKEVLEQRLEEL